MSRNRSLPIGAIALLSGLLYSVASGGLPAQSETTTASNRGEVPARWTNEPLQEARLRPAHSHVLDSAVRQAASPTQTVPATLSAARAAGDNCASPLVVDLATALTPRYIDNNSTCGHFSDYTDTCLGFFDGGEDIIYQLNATSDTCVQLVLNADTPYAGIAVSNTCPIGSFGECLGSSTSSDFGPDVIPDLQLTAGTYYVMIDTWPAPDCTPYSLEIAPCATGACCGGSSCTVKTRTACTDQAGVYLGDGTDCTEEPCNSGACCDATDGTCAGQLSETDCAALGETLWTPGLSCTDGSFACPAPGDNCSAPVTVSLPSALAPTYVNANTTCGRGDNYEETCLEAYDRGEDIIYKLDVTSELCVNITLNADTAWGGMAVDDHCPFDGVGQCLAVAATSDNAPDTISGLLLQPGQYFLIADTNPFPNCMDFVLEIAECATGACCTGTSCSVISQAACAAGGGNYLGDNSTCTADLCDTGACCGVASGTCEGFMSEADCVALGGTAWEAGLNCVNGSYTCPKPGDNCANPVEITVPADLAPSFVDQNTTCGRINDFDETCLGFFDFGEDSLYSLHVTEPICLNLDVLADKNFVGLALDDTCGPGGTCLAATTTFNNDPALHDVLLDPGTYSIMVDVWDICIPNYTLTITECETGACCVGGVCSVEYAAQCANLGGAFVGVDVPCGPNTCTEGGCCYSDGSCAVLDGAACAASGGVYRGDATSCSPNECPSPGDNCALPLHVNLPEELSYQTTDSTCGRANDYADTCLDMWDGGEDIVYELNVSAQTCVNIAMNADVPWGALLVDDTCPPGGLGDCLALANTDANPDRITGLLLSPGVYYLMADTFAAPDCMDFTLDITPCATGACCNLGGCSILTQVECQNLGGNYAGDDVACGTEDCDGNSQLDLCEVLASPELDCNGNLALDTCDLAGGVSHDCNGNNKPDECDADCNHNSVADECDISAGTSNDCQPDGVPDECQIGAGSLRAAQYLWDDGTMEDVLGIDTGRVVALNHFITKPAAEKIVAIHVAWGNTLEGNPATLYIWSDPNQDGSPADAQVIASAPVTVQSPSTGTFIKYEIGPIDIGPVGTSFFVGFLHDSTDAVQLPIGRDVNGVFADEGWVVGDLNGNLDPNDLGYPFYSHSLTKLGDVGFPSNIMIRADGMPNDPDCNDNQIPDECDIAQGTSADCDGNDLADECEFLDCDGNGVHDPCDILAGAADCNADGIPDRCQLDGRDCNSDGILDECQIAGDPDCNHNRVLDACDIASGASGDCQPDGIPDDCQRGDPSGANITADSSFEAGTPNPFWTEFSAAIGTPVCHTDICGTGGGTAGPYSGDWWVWLGGTAGPEVGYVAQTLTIPNGVATAEFYLWIGVGSGNGTDQLRLSVDDNVLFTVFENNPWYQSGYAPVRVDLTAYADGGTHTLRIECNLVGGKITNFNVDDVNVLTGRYTDDCNNNGAPDACDNCADLDGDGDADAVDYHMFRGAFGRNAADPAFNTCADYNGSGAVGLNDFQAWLECYRSFVGDPLAEAPGGGLDEMGDLDADGDVDLADFSAFQACVGGAGNADECMVSFDFNFDWKVNFEDASGFGATLTGPHAGLESE